MDPFAMSPEALDPSASVYKHVAGSQAEHYLNLSRQEKRELYACGADFVRLKDIPTWSEDTNVGVLPDKPCDWVPQRDFEVDNELNALVSLYRGDITTLEVDAIVNAANRELSGGGGVDGCIHRAAGNRDLLDEAKTWGECPPGKAVITCGFRLPARYIIHTCGPMGENGTVLGSCYLSSLDTMAKNKLQSIALPCISTGLYGYPNYPAAHVALYVARDWLEKRVKHGDTVVRRIVFCIFADEDEKIYRDLMLKYFPK